MKVRPHKVDRGRGVQTVNQFSEANNNNKKSLKKLWLETYITFDIRCFIIFYSSCCKTKTLCLLAVKLLYMVNSVTSKKQRPNNQGGRIVFWGFRVEIH